MKTMLLGGVARLGKQAFALGLVACSLALAPFSAHADEAMMIKSAPANAPVVLTIPDLAAAWQKTSALPVVKAWDEFRKLPALASEPDYQQFQLDMGKLERELGYPLTADELFGNVYNSLRFYAFKGTAGEKGEGVLILGVKDAKKAGRIVDLLIKENPVVMEMIASGMKNDDAMLTGTARVKVTRLELGKARGVCVGSAEETTLTMRQRIYMGVSGSSFVMANNEAALRRGLSGEPAGEALATVPEFQRLIAQANLKGSDAQLWTDMDAVASAEGKAALFGSLPGMTRSNKSVSIFKIVPDGVRAAGVSTANPAAALPDVKLKGLKGLAMLPSAPIAGFDYGLFDFNQLSQGMGMMLAMMGGVAPGSSPFDKFEQSTGISVYNELSPSLGHELIFSLNDFVFNPFPPYIPTTLDLTLAVQVKDAAKMTGVMQKLEKSISAMAPPQPGATGAPAPIVFKETKLAHGTVRAIDFGLNGIGLAYGFSGGFLIIGLNPPSVDAAMGRLAGGDMTADYKQMAAKGAIVSAGTCDVSAAVNKIILPALPLAASARPQANTELISQFLASVVSHVGTLSSVERVENGLGQYEMVVKMK